MKKLFFLVLFFAIGELHAQHRELNLEDCIDYAVTNSPKTKKQHFTNENYRQDYIETVADMLPSVGASTDAGWRFGRGLDPQTNTYGTTANFNNYYSLSATLPLFNGFTKVNALRTSLIARLRGTQQAQQVADEIAIATMQAYFDVIYYTGAVALAQKQLEESSANLIKIKKQEELGLKMHGDVAQIEAQAASDDYNLTHQQNLLETAILKLKENMNYPLQDQLAININIANQMLKPAVDALEIYDYARQNMPEAKIADYLLRESELKYMSTKGTQYPNIYLWGGYSTSYFKNITSASAADRFSTQIKDNSGESVGITVSIPIFNGLQRRTAINRSRNAMRIAEQENTESMRKLQNEIAQAAIDVQGLGKEFVQSVKRVDAYDEAHKANRHKFEQGTLSAIELQTSANQLLLARAQQLQVQLQYLLRSRLLEFYNGTSFIEIEKIKK